MNEDYQEDGLLGGKGFYIALMLCVSIIAVAAWMLVRDPEEPDTQAQADVVVTPYQVAADEPLDEPEPTVVIQQTQPPVQEVVEPVADEPVQQVSVPVDTQPEEISYVWPVVGPTELGYSMDKLVYNVTMGDWRTHDGIDIAAEAGEMVRAAASGLVEDVYTDDLYGVTVVINHGSGLYSYYAGMQAEPGVAIGDQVLVGDIIGAVGSTAICESAEPPHLHFAMSRDGLSLDPGDYLPAA